MRNRRRRRSRKGKLGFAYSLLMFLAIITVLMVSIGVFFKISGIKVEGSDIYSRDEIVSTSGITIGKNIFFINKYGAINRIFERFPYVSQVRIQRKLPGTVVIHITESVTAGAIEYKGYYWKFDASGKLLESVAAVNNPGCTIVSGVELLSPVLGEKFVFSVENKDKERALSEIFSSLLSFDLLKDVPALDIKNISDVRFTYKGQYEVMLGIPTELDYKLRVLKAAEEKLPSGVKGTLDLTLAGDKEPRFIPG